MKDAKLCSLLLLLGLLSACTRPEADSAKIKVVLPQQISGKMEAFTSTEILAHVVINVTGDGLTSPVLMTWDSCRDCANAPAAPSSFNVDVPTGKNRLFQVLAVYADSTSGGMRFYYGDVSKSLEGATATVAIAISPLGGSLPVISGRIGGQYITNYVGSDAKGPTGTISVKFSPAANKPAMLIGTENMANGWFQAMALTGVNLQYELKDLFTGQVSTLWNQPVGLDSPMFFPTESGNRDRRLRVAIPIHQRDDGSGVYKVNEADILVWGYWWAGTYATTAVSAPSPFATHAVCWNNAGLTSASQIKLYNSTSTNLNLSYSTSGTTPTNAALINASSPVSWIAIIGGVEGATSPCTGQNTAALYDKLLPVMAPLINQMGGDSAMGLKGFLRRSLATGLPVSIAKNPTSTDIAGQVFPGVQSIISGYRFYARMTGAQTHVNDETIDCAAFAQDQVPGFTLIGSGNVDSNGNFAINTSMTAAQRTSGGLGVVMCPVLSQSTARSGGYLDAFLFSETPSVPPTGLSWINPPIGMSSGVCRAVQVGLTGPGTVSNTQNRTVNLSTESSAGVYGTFYSSSGCASGALGQVAIPSGSLFSNIFYVKFAGAASNYFKLIATDAAFSLTNGVHQGSYGTPSTLSQFKIQPEVLRVMGSQCQPFVLARTGANGVPTNMNESSVGDVTGVSLSFIELNSSTPVTPTGAMIVTSCTETTGLTSVDFTSGVSEKPLFLKTTAGFSSADFRLRATYSSGAQGDAFVNPSPVAARLHVSAMAPLYQGGCASTSVQLIDAASNPVSAFVPYRLNFDTAHLQIFSDATCTTPRTPATLFTSGSGSDSFFVKALTGPTMTPLYLDSIFVSQQETMAITILGDNCRNSATMTGAICQSNANLRYVGESNGFQLVTTPGGCTNSVTPTCSGTDSLTLALNQYGNSLSGLNSDGYNNSSIFAGTLDSPAAEYCENLQYAGFSDWYLPDTAELEVIYLRSGVGTLDGLNTSMPYLSSNPGGNTTQVGIFNFNNGTIAYGNRNDAVYHVRCMRRM